MRYLVFECSDDGLGQLNWEGLASVRAADLADARAEVEALLRALTACAPGARAPLDEGGAWDWALDERCEDGWHTLHLSVVGPGGWAEALLRDPDQ